MMTGSQAQSADWSALPAAADLGKLGQHQVESARHGSNRQQGKGPDPLQAGHRLIAHSPRGRGCMTSPRQQAVTMGDSAAGGGREGQRLQQGNRRGDSRLADDRRGA